MGTEALANPILNSPYGPPERYFELGHDGPTGTILTGRRPSQSFIPIAASRKGKAEGEQEALDFDATGERIEENSLINDIRRQVELWRARDYPWVTPMSRKLLQHWAGTSGTVREDPMLFCQREAAETAIYLAEVAGRHGEPDYRTRLGEQNRLHKSRDTTRCDTTSVLPEPADAMICRCEPRWPTAAAAWPLSTGALVMVPPQSPKQASLSIASAHRSQRSLSGFSSASGDGHRFSNADTGHELVAPVQRFGGGVELPGVPCRLLALRNRGGRAPRECHDVGMDGAEGVEWKAPNSDRPPPKGGAPPLHLAAGRGLHDEITRLITAGVPVDEVFGAAHRTFAGHVRSELPGE